MGSPLPGDGSSVADALTQGRDETDGSGQVPSQRLPVPANPFDGADAWQRLHQRSPAHRSTRYGVFTVVQPR